MAELTGTGTTTTPQGGGTTATTPTTPAATSSTASTTHERRADSRSLVERLVAEHGTEARALSILADENWGYREQLRAFRDEQTQLKANQIPAGGVALTGPEKEAWDKIKVSGVPIDKVADTVKLAATLQADKEKTDRTAARTAVANDARLDPLVLDPLLDQFKLDVESRTEKIAGADNKIVDGKVAYVRKADDKNATWEKLADFIKRDGSPLKPFAAALAAKGTSTGNNGSTNGTTSTDAHGVTTHTVPDLSGDTSGSPGANDPVSRRLKARSDADAKRVNPLMPPKAATT